MWNSEEPNEFIQLIQDEQHDELYKIFQRSSLIVGLARWTKFFCYSFIIFQLACIIIDIVSPFAVHSPDIFTQLLFLTLVWAMVEILTIPVETISDFTTIDYQKNWISLDRKRFFYRRVKILASFNMIRAIGVSARPPAIIPGLFSSSTSKFALVVQTYDDKVIHVTDHNLTLEEANELCEEFSLRLSGVTAVLGEPDMDLAISSETRELVAVPCKRGILTLFDAMSLLSLKVFTSFTTSLLLIYLSVQIVVSFAGMFFSTDLRLFNQPSIQLLLGSERATAIDDTPEAPAVIPETIELAVNPDLPSIWQASRESETQSQIFIDPTGQSIKMDADRHPMQSPATKNDYLQHDNTRDYNKDTDVEVTLTLPEPADAATGSDEKLARAELLDDILKVVTKPENPQILNAAAIPAKNEMIPGYSLPAVHNYYYAPLTSSIPSVDISAISGSEVKKASQLLADSSIQPEVKVSPAIKVVAAQQPAKKKHHHSILPGYGIDPLVLIGEPLSIEEFGAPIFEFSSREGTQKFYEIFSLLTDKNGIIREINITSKISQELRTPQNIGIGTSIKALSQQYGPFTTSSEKPGIHYPRLGISFMPAVHDPQAVGAIKIYKPSGKASEN